MHLGDTFAVATVGSGFAVDRCRIDAAGIGKRSPRSKPFDRTVLRRVVLMNGTTGGPSEQRTPVCVRRFAQACELVSLSARHGGRHKLVFSNDEWHTGDPIGPHRAPALGRHSPSALLEICLS